jgi:hydroxymethylpyrimidine/phosphomethylpyrimidine kinase
VSRHPEKRRAPRKIVHNSKTAKRARRKTLPRQRRAPARIRPLSRRRTPAAAAAPAVVLCLSGHDPCGGAGLQADIEAVRAQGLHPATVVTALTVQDSRNAYAVEALPADGIVEQAELIFEDLPVASVKIGLLGSAENAEAVAALLGLHAGVPVVLDPVLRAGGGAALGDLALVRALLGPLLARATVITPNLAEARQLAHPARTRADCAAALLARGAHRVLITGGDETEEDDVLNTLHTAGGTRRWHWPRLPQRYHGSGCTLAASLAARLALGEPLETALENAQRYTWETLRRAYRIGRGQHFPRRLGT